MNEQIYHELILELAHSPLNKGMPADFDLSLKSQNKVCGDNIVFYLSFDKLGKVSDIHWDGDGCALSVSSASLFSEYLRGKTKEQIKKIKPATILKLLKMKKLNPSRMRCATLPLECMKNI